MKLTSILFLCGFLKGALKRLEPSEDISGEGAEYAKYFGLENARDDDFIYRFGVAGQSDESLAESTRVPLSSLPLLYELAHLWSSYVNLRFDSVRAALRQDPEGREWPLDAESEAQKSERLQKARQIARQMADLLITSPAELESQVAQLFEKAINVHLNIEDCLHVLALREMFDEAADRIDKESLAFYNAAVKIDLQCFNLSSKLQFFLRALDRVRYATKFSAEPFEQQRDLLFNDNLKRFGLAIGVVDALLKVKESFDYTYTDLATGSIVISESRDEIVRLITQLKIASERFSQDPISEFAGKASTWLLAILLFFFTN